MSRDPIAEKGGLNLYGFVSNDPIGYIDVKGLSELSAEEYREFIESRLRAGITDIDRLWRDALLHYLRNDPVTDCFWDCEDDMEELIEAFYKIVSDEDGDWNHAQGITAGIHTGDGSAVSHFFGGAEFEGGYELGDTAQDFFEYFFGGRAGDWQSDTAYAYAGADFSDYFDTWTERECRRRVMEFVTAGARDGFCGVSP